MFRLLSAAAIATVTAFAFAAPSSALSCLPPSPESSFANYNAAPELYEVWSGRFVRQGAIPETTGYVNPGDPTPRTIRYRFQGRRVGTSGAYGPISRFVVQVTPGCAGPWCASYPSNGEQVVGFFENTGSRVRSFEPNPCGGEAFPRTIENVDRISACFTSGLCN